MLIIGVLLGTCVFADVSKPSVDFSAVKASFEAANSTIKAYNEQNPYSSYPRKPENKHYTWKIDPNKPMLAITFDDGPGSYTDRLLDCLKRNNAKATFFLVGGNIGGRKSTVVRMRDEGHEIGNHSWNHPELSKLSYQGISNEITMTNNKIFEAAGVNCTIVRPPYGACNSTVRSVGASLGVSFYNWSVDTLDWKYRNANTVHNAVVNGAYDGAIILCHDIHKTTVDAMETAIPKLIEKGYQLVTVSELMSYSAIKVYPGGLYFRQ